MINLVPFDENATNGAVDRTKCGKIRWTPELDDALRSMSAQGLGRRDIARHLNLSRNTVIGRLYRLGLGFDKSTPREWTAEMDATLRAMKKEGISDREVSERLGVPYSAVVKYREKNFITAQHRPQHYRPARVKKSSEQDRARWRLAAAERKAREREARAAERDQFAELKANAFAALQESRLVSLLDLKADDCRWPIDGEAMMFCGCKKNDGDKTYCKTHRMLSNGRGTKSERTATKVLRQVSKYDFRFSMVA